MTLRDFKGVEKAMQSLWEKLTNNLAKLTEIDQEKVKGKQKLQEAEV